MIGEKFGLWTVLDKIKHPIRNEWMYKCICKCGNYKNLFGHALKGYKSTRCKNCHNKTHGMSFTSTYKIWIGMIQRCTNEKRPNFIYYGGRGITVCDRWFDFNNFLSDMGHRPDGLQIDRINNDGNYEPGNCRWVTAKQNFHNK